MSTHRYGSDRYEECTICGGSIDSLSPGYYKSSSEKFRHALCHETGEPPEGYVLEVTETDACCTNRQYNCGHTVYAPVSEQPSLCPECNPSETDASEPAQWAGQCPNCGPTLAVDVRFPVGGTCLDCGEDLTYMKHRSASGEGSDGE